MELTAQSTTIKASIPQITLPNLSNELSEIDGGLQFLLKQNFVLIQETLSPAVAKTAKLEKRNTTIVHANERGRRR